MEKNKIIYSLNVEDLQTVAKEEFDKNLTKDEIEILAECIGDYIPWQVLISDAIRDKITVED